MRLLTAFHLLIIAMCLVIGIIVFFTNHRRRANQSFLILSTLLVAWQSCMVAAFLSCDINMATAYIRGCMMIGVMIPICCDWVRASIVRHTESLGCILTSSPIWLTISILIGLSALTPSVILTASYPSVTIDDSIFAIPNPVYGVLFPLFGAFFLFSLFILSRRFLLDLRTSTGIKKTELQFILLGTCVSIFFGIITTFILPLFINNSQSVLFTPLSVFFLYIVVAYGIATRRIMDVAYFLRRLTAYTLLIACLAALYAGTFILLNHILRELGFYFPALSYFTASIAITFSMAPTYGLMQRFANRLFVHLAPLDPGSMIQSANSLMQSVSNTETLLHKFTDIIVKTLDTDRVCILIKDANQYVQYYPQDQRREVVTLSTDNLISQALSEQREPLVPAVLSRMQSTPVIADACRLLEEFGFAAAAHMSSQGGLTGIVLLGPRISGRIYGAPEQQALQLLCNHLAIALNNARLYTEVQNAKIYNDLLVDGLASGVIAADTNNNLTVFNREAQRILRNNTAPSSITSLPHDLAEVLIETLTNNHGVRDKDIILRWPDETETPIRVSSSVFYSHTRQMMGAFLVINDLTTVRQLELQVRRTDRLASIGTLAAGMAHEIKNPLVSIKTFTQLLPERFDDPDFRNTFTSLVGTEVVRIDTIVNQLLRFSRPSRPVLTPSHLHEILDHATKLMHEQLRQKGIHLEQRFLAPRDLINADAHQLGQALINFFLNAIEAMSESGTLTVITSMHTENRTFTPMNNQSGAPYVTLTIQDTGAGIDPETLTHIFDPFFTTKSQGTGLGLSVAHGIIHEHGGLIDVKSDVGHGTSFTLQFPLLTEEKSPA